MPSRTEYPLKLSQIEVIELFVNGKYSANPETGIVSRCYKNGNVKPIFTFIGGRYVDTDEPGFIGKGSLWCKLYNKPKMRALPVSHCIWLSQANTPIPSGFEIHHRNLIPGDNRWINLFCLFKMDHGKLHNGHPDIIEESPF